MIWWYLILPKTIGVIVPGYNVSVFGAETLRTIINASLTSNNTSIVIVAIDDHSADGTLSAFCEIQNEFSNHPIKDVSIEVISHVTRMGFSRAILSGLEQILRTTPTCDLVVVFPGNDQIDQSSISQLFDNSLPSTVSLGYRMNKLQERPFFKWLPSIILQQISRWLVFPSIKDLTGQFVVPPHLFLQAVKDDPGHAWSVKLTSLILQSELPITQMPIYLKKGFKKRPRNQGFRQYPRLSDMAQYIRSLLSEFTYLAKTHQLGKIKNRQIKTIDSISLKRKT